MRVAPEHSGRKESGGAASYRNAQDLLLRCGIDLAAHSRDVFKLGAEGFGETQSGSSPRDGGFFLLDRSLPPERAASGEVSRDQEQCRVG